MYLVEIKVGCFWVFLAAPCFLNFWATPCFLNFWLFVKRLIAEYMEIFTKETNNVALVESKESAFQL